MSKVVTSWYLGGTHFLWHADVNREYMSVIISISRSWTSFNLSASRPVNPGGAGAAILSCQKFINRTLTTVSDENVRYCLVFLRCQFFFDLLLDRFSCSHLLLPLTDGDVACQYERRDAEKDEEPPEMTSHISIQVLSEVSFNNHPLSLLSEVECFNTFGLGWLYIRLQFTTMYSIGTKFKRGKIKFKLDLNIWKIKKKVISSYKQNQ